MKLLVSAARVRYILAGARTEKDVEYILRAHRIRFSYDTQPGFLSFRIPARTGAVIVYKTASRSAPFMVRSAAPGSVAPVVPVRRLYHEY